MRTLLAATLFVTLHALAQAGPPGINPAVMLSPGMANPFGTGTQHGMGMPILGGLMSPSMQMAPNLLSHRHLQHMTNPYLGGPAAGNPYLQPSLPNPYAPPGFAPGLPFGGGYSQPAVTLPFPASNPLSPGPIFGRGRLIAPPPASTPAWVQPLPFDPSSWFGQLARPPAK